MRALSVSALWIHASRLGRVLDLLHHQHDLLVGPAVQRALERADAGHDRGVHVGQGRRGDAGREGGGVELVIGVEDEGDVEGLGGQRRRLLAAHHVQEVARRLSCGFGATGGLAAADALPRRHQRGQLRGEAQRLSQRGLAAVVGRVRIEGGERGHAGPDHLHRGRLLGERLQHRDQLRRELPVRGGRPAPSGARPAPCATAAGPARGGRSPPRRSSAPRGRRRRSPGR